MANQIEAVKACSSPNELDKVGNDIFIFQNSLYALGSNIRSEIAKLGNHITLEGILRVENGLSSFYSKILEEIELGEEALLASRKIGLWIAEELALYQEVKNDPTIFEQIKVLQARRLEEVNESLKRVNHDSALGHTLTREKSNLERILKSYETKTVSSIELTRKMREEQMADLQGNISKLASTYIQNMKELDRADAQVLESREKAPASIVEESIGFFNQNLHATEDQLELAITRRDYFYLDNENAIVKTKAPFQENAEVLQKLWNWDENKQKNIYNLLSASGSGILLARAQRMYGAAAGPYENVKAGVVPHAYPQLTIRKREDGNYELYFFNISVVKSLTTTNIVESFVPGIVSVVLDGKKIDEENKSFADSVLEAHVTPPIIFKKSELESYTEKPIDDELRIMDLKGERMMMEALLDSIEDHSFKEGARTVLTAYQAASL